VFELQLDNILMHLMMHLMMHKMSSHSYGDYTGLVTKLTCASNITVVLQFLAPRLSNPDCREPFEELNRFQLSDLRDTVIDLTTCELSEFVRTEYQDDRHKLIMAISKNKRSQKKLESRLGRLAHAISGRFGLDWQAIEREIVLSLFKEADPVPQTSSDSVFTNFPTVDGRFQCAIFIVVQCPEDFAINTLTALLDSKETSALEKSLAFVLLAFFGQANGDESDCHYRSVAETFRLEARESFSQSVLDSGNPTAMCEILRYCIDHGIADRTLALRIITELKRRKVVPTQAFRRVV
jgi:hypothetical protein